MRSPHPVGGYAVEQRLLQPAKRWTTGHLDLLNLHRENAVSLRKMIPSPFLPRDNDNDTGRREPVLIAHISSNIRCPVLRFPATFPIASPCLLLLVRSGCIDVIARLMHLRAIAILILRCRLTEYGVEFEQICRLFVDDRQPEEENPFHVVHRAVSFVAEFPAIKATTYFQYLVQFISGRVDSSPFHYLP